MQIFWRKYATRWLFAFEVDVELGEAFVALAAFDDLYAATGALVDVVELALLAVLLLINDLDALFEGDAFAGAVGDLPVVRGLQALVPQGFGISLKDIVTIAAALRNELEHKAVSGLAQVAFAGENHGVLDIEAFDAAEVSNAVVGLELFDYVVVDAVALGGVLCIVGQEDRLHDALCADGNHRCACDECECKYVLFHDM